MSELFWPNLNKIVKMLLRKALGLEKRHNGDQKADFAEFSGVWSQADARHFEKKTEDLRKVDSRDWQ
jgi:hypothetical protein